MGSSGVLQIKLRKLFFWIKNRFVQTPVNDTKPKIMIFSLWLMTGIVVTITSFGLPSGFGVILDLVIFLLLNAVVFTLATILIGFLLSLFYVPLPRLFIGSLAYTVILTYFILVESNLGSLFALIITVGYVIIGLCLGIILSIYQLKQVSPIIKFVGTIIPGFLILFLLFWSPSIENDQLVRSFAKNNNITPLAVENPAKDGNYSFQFLTYASGFDNHRREFGDHTDLISKTVDGSEYIEDWHPLRKFFWGFDEKELPINGRVWMPEGDKRFPLVLIVHGNHTMEHFSDRGYDYLGELLASRGYIAISVDQNFLNYSNWTGIPKNDMKLRAWMLMQHLLQIDKYKEMPKTPFYQKVDMNRVAIIGHSRGGQAAAMVGDYQKWFDEDPTLTNMVNINIEAVIGIAPTDRLVDKKWPELKNISYLTLHGARDGDVQNYHGDRQFSRTSITADSDHFKAGVYIAEANHSQFNKDWGQFDQKLPGGLFLDQSEIMDGVDQREVAKVYISAFIESTLGDNEEYISLFRDVRYGSEWLPNTQYVTRFENSQFHSLVDFNKTNNKTKFSERITAEGIGFDLWEIKSVVNRSGNKKQKQGMLFEWQNSGTYSLMFPERYRKKHLTESFEGLFLSIANMENEEDNPTPIVPKLEVTLVTSKGIAVTVPLERYKEISATIHTQYTRNRYLRKIFKKGKYSESSEPVFQTYEIPLASFKEKNADWQLADLERITVSFTNGPGKLMVDEIGFVKKK